MNVTGNGVPVPELIQTVKQAIAAAGISAVNPERDIRVSALQLTMHVIAARTLGGGLEFCIPFIGMPVRFGAKLTRQDTHEIDISLLPPDLSHRPELRDAGVESVLVEAVSTIRAAVASAAGGDDPFVLGDSSVSLSFAVTADGGLTLGVDADLSSELTHTLRLTLVPA